MDRRPDERKGFKPPPRGGSTPAHPDQNPPEPASTRDPLSGRDDPASRNYTDPGVDHPHHQYPLHTSDRDLPRAPGASVGPTATRPGDTPYENPEAAHAEPARGRPRRTTAAPDDGISSMRRAGTMADTGSPSQRDELDKILPGPGHTEAVDQRVRDRMDQDSPDGRPPALAGRRQSRMVFYTALVVVWVVVITAVYWVGGFAMSAMVLLLTAIYIGYASWPVWRAGLERRADEHRAEREVELETNPDSPADRQPPAQN
jgi:hypothetical protein